MPNSAISGQHVPVAHGSYIDNATSKPVDQPVCLDTGRNNNNALVSGAPKRSNSQKSRIPTSIQNSAIKGKDLHSQLNPIDSNRKFQTEIKELLSSIEYNLINSQGALSDSKMWLDLAQEEMSDRLNKLSELSGKLNEVLLTYSEKLPVESKKLFDKLKSDLFMYLKEGILTSDESLSNLKRDLFIYLGKLPIELKESLKELSGYLFNYFQGESIEGKGPFRIPEKESLMCLKMHRKSLEDALVQFKKSAQLLESSVDELPLDFLKDNPSYLDSFFSYKKKICDYSEILRGHGAEFSKANLSNNLEEAINNVSNNSKEATNKLKKVDRDIKLSALKDKIGQLKNRLKSPGLETIIGKLKSKSEQSRSCNGRAKEKPQKINTSIALPTKDLSSPLCSPTSPISSVGSYGSTARSTTGWSATTLYSSPKSILSQQSTSTGTLVKKVKKEQSSKPETSFSKDTSTKPPSKWSFWERKSKPSEQSKEPVRANSLPLTEKEITKPKFPREFSIKTVN